MKKIAYLFVAFAFVGAIVLSSCKTKVEPAATEATETVEEAAPVADTVAADTTVAVQ